MPISMMPFRVMPLSVIPFRVMPFSVMPFRVMPFSVMPFSVMHFSVMPFCVMPVYVMTICRIGLLPFSFELMHVQFGWLDINYRVLNFVIDIPPQRTDSSDGKQEEEERGIIFLLSIVVRTCSGLKHSVKVAWFPRLMFNLWLVHVKGRLRSSVGGHAVLWWGKITFKRDESFPTFLFPVCAQRCRGLPKAWSMLLQEKQWTNYQLVGNRWRVKPSVSL